MSTFFKNENKTLVCPLFLDKKTFGYDSQNDLRNCTLEALAPRQNSAFSGYERLKQDIIRGVFKPGEKLLPGMFVHAQLQEGIKQKAILAPQQGVTRDLKGQATALVVNAQNKVELRVIKADRVIGDKWLVTEGLNAGDKIITEGLQFVQPGVEVKTVPAKNVASAQKADAAPAKTDSKG